MDILLEKCKGCEEAPLDEKDVVEPNASASFVLMFATAPINPFAESSASLKGSNTSSLFLPMLPVGWAHQHFRLDPMELMAFGLLHRFQWQM
jgi:hypothetical protein